MITDEAFARLVAEDVKNRINQEQKDYLRLPENWERWRGALLSLLENIDQQLAELEREGSKSLAVLSELGKDGRVLSLEAAVSLDDKRKKITRFRFYVEQRLAEADRMVALGEGDLRSDLRLASFLLGAIKRHRDLMREFNLEPTEIDTALWAAIDGLWEFDKIDHYRE